jgi:hypothetical protein
VKRDDHALGEAAIALQLGGLSDSEAVLDGGGVAPVDNANAERDFVESLLYEHVMAAQRARLAMDRMSWGPEYHAHYRAREIALHAASRNYQLLLELGGEISAVLAQLINAEGGLAP